MDVYERRSHMDAELRAVGVEVEVRPLPVADYEVGTSLVERKRVKDLHLSIIGRRLWPQVARLRDASPFPYLLVEGEDIDAGPLSERPVRGALLAVDELGVGVIRATSAADSALWLALLAARSSRHNAPRRRYRRSPPRGAAGPEAMLTAVPRISTGSARALIDAFGSVTGVVQAGPDEWRSVPGIGPVRAASLYRMLRHNPDP
jgi:DNA excision repair protein ERCC-4